MLQIINKPKVHGTYRVKTKHDKTDILEYSPLDGNWYDLIYKASPVRDDYVISYELLKRLG